MNSASPLASIAVVGSGITAWSAAAALKRRIPLLEVKIVSAPVEPAALADRMISTLPSIQAFHHDIGLTEADTIRGAASGLRLGTLFEHWVEGLPDFVHAYGSYGAPIGGVSFHQLWLRERNQAELAPFDRFSHAAMIARSGDVRLAQEGEAGLQLTLDRYGEMIRAYALHLGVAEERRAFRSAELRAEDGFIAKIRVEGEGEVGADLFIDCSGPASLLRSRLGADFIDWSKWLPCDRLIIGTGPPHSDVIAMDRSSATSAGWQWVASSPEQSSFGLACSSAYARAPDLERELPWLAAAEEIGLRQGRWDAFWIRNCVAVGDSAVAIEPLEWTNLHLAHSQIDRIVALLPGRDCAPVELAEFNRQCAAEADRVRDFLCLHYLGARRPEPFWKEAASRTPPPSLEHTLAQFLERGRLPYYEEETFARDSWLAVLLGEGFEPQSTDPLAELVGPAQARQAIQAMSQSLERSTPFASASSPIDLNPRGAR